MKQVLKGVRSTDMKRFILEQTLLASIVDGRRSEREVEQPVRVVHLAGHPHAAEAEQHRRVTAGDQEHHVTAGRTVAVQGNRVVREQPLLVEPFGREHHRPMRHRYITSRVRGSLRGGRRPSPSPA